SPTFGEMCRFGDFGNAQHIPVERPWPHPRRQPAWQVGHDLGDGPACAAPPAWDGGYPAQVVRLRLSVAISRCCCPIPPPAKPATGFLVREERRQAAAASPCSVYRSIVPLPTARYVPGHLGGDVHCECADHWHDLAADHCEYALSEIDQDERQ